jgi:tetratricopeptide (TPR) repeat protein
MPLAPVYLTLAGALAASPEGPIVRVPMWLRTGVAAAAFLALVAWCVPYQRHVLELSPIETREAGRALATIARPGERVVSRKGHIGYYAGIAVVPFPRFRTLQELAGYARDHHAQYVYFSWYEALLRQEFAFLLDTTAAIPGLTVVHVTARNPSVLYRIGPDFGRVPAWLADENEHRVHLARALVQVLPDSMAWTHRMVLGADALANGRPEDALRQAELATRVRAHDGLGWALQGEALRVMNRLPQARTAFARALALDGSDLQARVGLGWTELADGDSAAAAEIWRPAIGRTRNTEALIAMATLYDRRGEHSTADSARAALRAVRP